MTAGTEPSVALLLARLSETVRYHLVPMAGSELLRDQLASLASVLSILGSEGPAISRQIDEDHADLAETLRHLDRLSNRRRAGTVGDPEVALEEPMALDGSSARSLIAGLARNRVESGSAAVAGYQARDRLRPWAALFGPPPDQGHTFRPQGPSLDDAVGVYVEEQVQEWQRESGFQVEVGAEMSDGYSALTRLASIGAGAGRREVVIRVQSHSRPIDGILTSVRRQACFLRGAAKSGVPVPAVLRVIDEPNATASILITDRVEGYVPVPWTSEGRAFVDRLRLSGGANFLAVLASIHATSMPSEAAASVAVAPATTIPAPGATDDAVPALHHLRERLERWEQIYRGSVLRPDPVVEEVLHFLTTEARPWGSNPVLVHGDFRPGNMVFDPDGLAIRAVLDWDSAAQGDYHEDLGYALSWPFRGREGHALGLFDDNELIDRYAQLSGRVVMPDALRYYEMLATFHRYLGFVLLARDWVDNGGDMRSGRAWLALRNDRQQLSRLLDS